MREMIVGDIGRLRELGARQLASDLSLVLNCFLASFPEARMAPDADGELSDLSAKNSSGLSCSN